MNEDYIIRIQSNPEHMAFRKKVLGALWNDFDNAVVLGPYPMSRLNMSNFENSKSISHLPEIGDLVLYDFDTQKTTTIKVPNEAWYNAFDQYMDEYTEAINQLPNQLKVLYESVIDEIQDYLKNRYSGISLEVSQALTSGFHSRLITRRF